MSYCKVNLAVNRYWSWQLTHKLQEAVDVFGGSNGYELQFKQQLKNMLGLKDEAFENVELGS